MKRYIRILFVFVAMMLAAGTDISNASDVGLGAILLKLKSDRSTERLEHMAKLDELRNQVAQAKTQYQKMKAIYNEFSGYIEGGKTIKAIYESGERLYNDYEMLSDYIKYLEDNGIRNLSNVTQVYNYADAMLDEWTVLKDQIEGFFKSKDENLTMNERFTNIQKICDEVDEYCSSLEDVMMDAMVETNQVYAAYEAEQVLREMYAGEDGDVAVDIDVLEAVRNTISTVQAEEKEFTFDKTKTDYLSNNLISNIFGLVTAIIGVMTVCLLVWGFARRTKGDPQRQDSLWKVFAGCLFSILILQMLKAMLFDTGGLLNL